MKEKKPYRNSRDYTRERVLQVILPVLRKPGRIQLKDCWELTKHVTSYSVLTYVFKEIMDDMIKQGCAGKTIWKGVYMRRKSCYAYNPKRITVPDSAAKYARTALNDVDKPKAKMIRPPACISTQEATINKYLNMKI